MGVQTWAESWGLANQARHAKIQTRLKALKDTHGDRSSWRNPGKTCYTHQEVDQTIAELLQTTPLHVEHLKLAMRREGMHSCDPDSRPIPSTCTQQKYDSQQKYFQEKYEKSL